MEERAQQMLKSKVCGSVPEVIFPDFPDDDNTVTTTVTKSRRVSFGTNFIKEFIVGSAISAQCVSEYEQAFSSSDSSNPNSSLSAVESGILDPNPFIPDTSKIHPTEPPIFKPPDVSTVEHAKQTTFSRTICFSADSPTVDMEFTEGCISLAKSILDKKNKEMTVIIQAKSKEPKDDRSRKEDMTKIFDGSEVEMSMTRCLKSRENIQEGRRFENDSTKIFNKFDDEMSITRCDKGFKMRQPRTADDSDFLMASKENRMPLDLIMRQLDGDDSDTDVFNPEKSFSDMLNSASFDLSYEKEKLNLNESMDISRDFQNPPPKSQLSNSTREDFMLDSPTTHLPLSSPTQQLTFTSKEDSLLGSPMEVVSEEMPKMLSPEQNVPLDCTKHLSMEISQEQVLIKDSLEAPMQCVALENSGVKPLESPVESPMKSPMESPAVSPMKSPVVSPMKSPMKSPEVSSVKSPMENSKGESPKEEPLLQTPAQQLQLKSPEGHITTETPKEHPPVESPKVQPSFETPSRHLTVESQDEHISVENLKENISTNIPEHLPSVESTQENITESSKSDTNKYISMDDSLESIQQHPPTETSMEHVALQTPTQPALDKSQEHVEKTPVLADVDEIDAEVLKPPSNEEIPVLEKSITEPLLRDVRVIETLKEESKETNCLWTVQDIRYPRTKTPGLLSINFSLLQSSTTMEFTLKKSKKRTINTCSIITDKAIHFKEERTPIHPEYNQVLQFGYKQQEEFFNDCGKKLTALNEIPYFLDEINLHTRKINTYLEQMYEILISYPGSSLQDTRLSFRLFSYPLFISTIVTVDLANLYKITDSSLSFKHSMKKLKEKKICNIFQDCLKHKNCLCEFIIRSNEYLIDAERGTGYVSKRGHVRLLPEELRL